MKKLNTFLSVLSLILTSFVLIFVVNAWYVSNDQVSANGIVGKTEGTKGTFYLYYWDDSIDEWKLSQNSVNTELWPNDVVYFKLVSTGVKEGVNYQARFNGISTSLNTEKVTAKKIETTGDTTTTTYQVLYDSTVMYESATKEIKVKDIDDDGKTVEKTLYSLSDNLSIALKDYKIENVIKLYTNPTIESDTPKDKGTTKADNLTDYIFNEKVASANPIKYFALTFDSTSDNQVDSYYQYQALVIKQLLITAV